LRESFAGIAQGLNVVKVSVADIRVEHEVKLVDFTKWLTLFWCNFSPSFSLTTPKNTTTFSNRAQRKLLKNIGKGAFRHNSESEVLPIGSVVTPRLTCEQQKRTPTIQLRLDAFRGSVNPPASAFVRFSRFPSLRSPSFLHSRSGEIPGPPM